LGGGVAGEAGLRRLAVEAETLAKELQVLHAASERRKLMADIQFYARGVQTPVSPAMLSAFARHSNKAAALLHGALFLHRELPFRLAMRVHNLDSLPRGLMVLPELQEIRDWYVTSFQELREFHFSKPQPRSDDEPRFHKVLGRIFDRHVYVPKQMALACGGLRRQLKHFYGDKWEEHPDRERVQEILQSFFLSRVGIRFLLEQQLTLHDQVTSGQAPEGLFGLLSLQVDAPAVVRAAIKQVQAQCPATMDLHFNPKTSTTFAHIPSHMEFIVRQMLEHAVDNHIMKYGAKAVRSGTAPRIGVVVADGPQCDHVCIRVEDLGDGLPRSKLPTLWSYLHQDAEPRVGPASSIYGVPLARLTAEYFGGQLTVVSLEGRGTTAYVHLRKMTEKSDQTEQLPAQNPLETLDRLV